MDRWGGLWMGGWMKGWIMDGSTVNGLMVDEWVVDGLVDEWMDG